jgi:hypothetical protein
MRTRAILSAVLVMALAGCSESPTASAPPLKPASSVTTEGWQQFTAEWWGCTEPLVVEGKWRGSWISVYDRAGGNRQILHYVKIGTAVGSVSGRRYTFHESSHYISTTASAGAATFTIPVVVRLIGQGSATNMSMTGIVHETVNAAGELVSSVSEFAFKCG